MTGIWREKRSDSKNVVSKAVYIFALNIFLSTAFTGAGPFHNFNSNCSGIQYQYRIQRSIFKI